MSELKPEVGKYFVEGKAIYFREHELRNRFVCAHTMIGGLDQMYDVIVKLLNKRATDPRLKEAVEEIKKYINNSEMSSARDGAIVTLQYIYKHIPELKEVDNEHK